jgi:hypothetical protein
MKIVTVNQDGTLQIPVDILSGLSRSQRWVLVSIQHALFLKPIEEVDVLDRVSIVEDEEPMSLDEICEEVHQYRKEKHANP